MRSEAGFTRPDPFEGLAGDRAIWISFDSPKNQPPGELRSRKSQGTGAAAAQMLRS
jgi:hypothetical protein